MLGRESSPSLMFGKQHLQLPVLILGLCRKFQGGPPLGLIVLLQR